MIPQEKSAAVSRALTEAFGVTAFEDISRVTNGLGSDLLFRIVVRGTSFLLRIMMRVDERNDPSRIYTCMKAAAEAGLAPHVWYANVEDALSITDIIEPAPFSASEALIRVPGALRKLHKLPPFPKTFNYVTAHNGFIWRFRKANLLPKVEIDEVFHRYEQICAVYPRTDSDMVSCHNDLKPENLVFDGNRLWLMDWQAAFINDRYFDLAVPANFVVADDAAERNYLRDYFGQPADAYQAARFFLMRQVMHMLAAAVFLMLGSSGKTVGVTETLPAFPKFHQRIWAGEVDLADNNMKIAYGRIHWEQMLQNLRQARFEDALRIVSGRHGRDESLRLLLPAAPSAS